MWNTSGKEKVKSLSFWKVPTNNNQKQFAFLFRNFSLSLFPVFSMLKWLCKVRLNTTQLKFLPPLQSLGLSFCPFSGLGRWIPPSRCDQHPLLDWGTPARPPAVAGQGAHTDGLPQHPLLQRLLGKPPPPRTPHSATSCQWLKETSFRNRSGRRSVPTSCW